MVTLQVSGLPGYLPTAITAHFQRDLTEIGQPLLLIVTVRMRTRRTPSMPACCANTSGGVLRCEYLSLPGLQAEPLTTRASEDIRVSELK